MLTILGLGLLALASAEVTYYFDLQPQGTNKPSRRLGAAAAVLEAGLVRCHVDSDITATFALCRIKSNLPYFHGSLAYA